MTSVAVPNYLYIGPRLDVFSVFASDQLADTTERHQVHLRVGDAVSTQDPIGELTGRDVAGVVLGMARGVAGGKQLRVGARVLRRGLRLWLYWPDEQAVECVDAARLRNLRWQRGAIVAIDRIAPPLRNTRDRYRRLRSGLRWVYRGEFAFPRYDLLAKLEGYSFEAQPVPFQNLEQPPSADRPLAAGLYLRTDFWGRISSGGSYGHTCYVAKELNALTKRFASLLANRFVLLDSLGVQQVVMERPPFPVASEEAMIKATDHYLPLVRTACQLLRPDFIYERLCLGNYVAALLSRELQIPYIVEYNGSEISMQRTFAKTAPVYEDLFVKIEEVAFRQATVISVVSEHVKRDLVSRGIDAAKIVVNPNGADLDSYAPATPEEKRQLRATLGFDDSHRVVGFTGTFGGWHGIDVLAAAIPRIAAADPSIRFLIIGDGTYKPQLDEEVSRAGIDDRVIRVGSVPQVDGARLLKACDIFVSPHNTHMVDSRFFGSPTKLFEYMAMGGGIVASDLEQIGQVLSPALRLEDLRGGAARVTSERAVLCTPGDVDEFVNAVVGLARHPDVIAALGRNARQAVADHYSWKRHVARLWEFVAERTDDGRRRPVDTGDAYKQQVQNQWDNNPVGSETAKKAQPHTLEWFLEVERYRYGVYAPWMPAVMEFGRHAGEQVLEIGGGMGTDLAQFAKNGAKVTDVDLSAGHLELAQENFRLRGLTGCFVHHDAEKLPFDSDMFDLVYTNGVLHHTPNTSKAIAEISRVLKPGGRVIAMLYAENSLQYWRNLVWHFGLKSGALGTKSIGDIMSRSVERTGNDARPLVKVYTKRRLRSMFSDFTSITIVQRQLAPEILPSALRRFLPAIERFAGWNLIVKARKPQRS